MPRINPKHFRVAIFGSARIRNGHHHYSTVHKLAEALAHEGVDIVTGGGPGLMDAAARGHFKGRQKRKLHTIGLAISLPKEQKDSYHLDIKREFHRFSERLDTFMQLSDAVIVAPGGIGTLLEFFYSWQLVQVRHVCDMPIILLGRRWKELIKWIKKECLETQLMSKEDFTFIYQVDNYKSAISIIRDFKSLGNEQACRNYTKYRVL